LVLCVFAF